MTPVENIPGTAFSHRDVNDIVAENERRNARRPEPYDPLTGFGCCGPRLVRRLPASLSGCHGELHLPEAMVDDPGYNNMATHADYVRLRSRHDFEFWAASCVRIHDKLNGGYIPFIPNGPQRRVLAMIDDDRRAGRPLRVVMLKARQWGGSTLIQMYFAWIQCVLKRSWHSLICAHIRSTSAQIRSMYSRMLADYPDEFWADDDGRPQFRAFEGMSGMRLITGRDCQVTLASSFRPDSVRGLDYAMAHLSEVAFWKDTDTMRPEEFVQAIVGGIPMVPLSFVAIESTANGVGNFFHTLWCNAREGRSAFRPVFVPWYEIAHYRLNLTNPHRIAETLTNYEWMLWSRGLTLEQIAWYRCKLGEMSGPTAMKAEYPTDDVEAFAATGSCVFSAESIDRLRAGCRGCEPERGDMAAQALKGPGALVDVRFVSDPKGSMEVWERPEPGRQPRSRYLVAVDVGGRSHKSDWSVITVLDRLASPRPAIVAQWRGHCDHDLLGWRAAMVASWYADALLVIESNTLESGQGDGPSRYILSELVDTYPNLYMRTSRDAAGTGTERRPGFHTNRATKTMAITTLIAAVREGSYTERSHEACNEMALYEQLPNGAYGAKAGHHDDLLMTRAIALYVSENLMADNLADPSEQFPSLPLW